MSDDVVRSRPPDLRRFSVTLTARQRDLLVILREQQPELPSMSVNNDPAWTLSVIIAAYDGAWNQ